MARAIIEHARDIVIVCPISSSDPADSRIEYVNNAFTNVTGYTADEAIGQAPRFLQGPETSKSTVDEIRSALCARRTVQKEILNYDRAGRAYWLEMSIFPVALEGSEATHFVAIERDVSERKRFEVDRRAMEALLASVFAVIEHGLLVVDAQGRVLLANPAFSMLFGWAREKLVGRSYLAVIDVEDRDRVATHHAQLMSGRAPERITARCLRSDNSVVESGLTAYLAPQGDGRSHVVISFAPPVSGFPEVDSHAAFEAVLERRLANEGSVPSLVAGRLQLIGLKDLVESLETKSVALAERALGVAEAHIRRRLGPRDVYSRVGPDGFVICFSDLSEEEARFKADAIGREIRARLLGEASVPATVVAQAASISIGAEDVALHGSIADAVASKLNEVAKAAEKSAREILAHAFKNEAIETIQVYAGIGRPAPLVSAHLPAAMQAQLDRAFHLHPNDEIVRERDVLMLGLATQWVSRRLSDGPSNLVMIPVSFKTFESKRSQSRYIDLCRSLSAGVRQRMFFMLTDLPADVGQTRFADVAMALSPFVRGVGVALDRADRLAWDGNRVKIQVVSVPCSAVYGTSSRETQLSALIRRAHVQRIRLLVTGVSEAVASKLKDAGVDLLAGGIDGLR
jgi:PAS domain S-box-containing protein